MTTTTSIRTVAGVDLPAAGPWRIDPGHTEVGFVGRHLVFTKVRGRFRKVEGTIHVAEDPVDTTVEVVIDVASVESGSQDRDDHLRSSDLFDVANHPTATFRGRADGWSDATGRLVGDLTLKGVTKPVALDVEYLGHVADPWGGERVVFSASTVIDRTEWGVDWNMPLETGGLLVSKEIRLELELEAVRD